MTHDQTQKLISDKMKKISQVLQDRIDSEELRVKSLASRISTQGIISETHLIEVENYRLSIKQLKSDKSLVKEICNELMKINFEKEV